MRDLYHLVRLVPFLATLALLVGPSALRAEEPPPGRRPAATWPGLTRSGAVLLPNGWSLKPAGRQAPLGDFPILIAECPTEPVLAVLHAGYGEHEVITLDAASGKTIARYALPVTFGGLAWTRDGKALFVGGGTDDVIDRFDHPGGGLLARRTTIPYPGGKKGVRLPAGLALSGDGTTLWVANAFGHSVARFDAATGELKAEVGTGADSYPYGLALDEGRGRLYVSLWAGAQVAVLDAKADTIVAHWPAQEHPNELLLAREGKVLYVANANRNTVTVFDTEAGKALETIGTAIAPGAPSGSTPNSLALAPDGSILFVANANTNDVAAVNVAEPGHAKPLGLIPVGWYPTSVRVARDGKTLYVANGKGATSKANREGPNPVAPGGSGRTTREYIAGLFRGTLSLIPMPTAGQMAAYTRTVYACSPVNPGAPVAVATAGRPDGSPIPARVGDPSPITHVVYIVKENRTYDQVFGDLPAGNGEDALCLFPEEVTPNHHALAREFVLLDNFYVESEVSADGHEWSLGAYATDYVERTWPLYYRGNRQVPYPSEGKLTIARPAGGYLWDRAAAKGVGYFSFGEFVENPKGDRPATTRVEALRGHFDPQFMGFNLDYTDQKRADRFLEVLADWERTGEMPRLVIMRLPNDHTAGTGAGKATPTAMVADNDLALGRVVEGLSHSRFWPKLAIFVVEDDAQNGPDHVDAHRTVALVAGPHVRRGAVDSTMYSTSSMLRTMELILGLEPMSQFDAAARPMWASFAPEPDPTPYRCRPARVDLKATNSATAWGAETSRTLDLAREDAADDLIFNEIIWKSVKGAGSPMPPPVRAAFVLPRVAAGDDED